LQLFGKNWADPGAFVLYATSDANTRSMLYGKPNGTLIWNGKNLAMQEDVVPRSGGAVMTGTQICRVSNDYYLNFCGGTSWGDGATISVRGKNIAESAGTVIIQACIGTQGEQQMYICPNGTWTWSGTAVQVTSDQRLKQQISNIDDKLLDAWEDVLPCQFKYNEAVNEKGDTARLHTGYVVQQIDEACKSHNVDISEYGLYCHEEYPERTEEVEVKQDDGSVIKETKVLEPAKEYYSLRYTEALIVECAYLRREVKRLSERLEKLEK